MIKKKILNINNIIKSRFVIDSIWSLLGNVIGKGLALLAGIVIARFLGRDIYGEYGMIRNTIISISLFSTFGLGYTSTKFVAEYKIVNPPLLSLISHYSEKITLIISGTLALLLFVFSEYVSAKILNAAHLNFSLKIVSAWIVFNALTTTQIGILAGLREFKKLARFNVITGIITFVLSFVFTWYWNLNGALLALLVSQIFNWFLNYNLVQKKIPLYNYSFKNKKFSKEILNFSFPVALQEAIFSIIYWTLSYLIIKFSSYGELGIYTAAMQWNAIILFIPGILRNVILSHLSEAIQNDEKYNQVLNLTLTINLISTLIPFLFVLFAANYIILLYGPSFEGLKIVLKLATLSTVFLSLSNVYAQAYLSKGKNWQMLGFRSLRDLGTLGLAYFFIIHFKGEKSAYYLSLSVLIISIIFLLTMSIFYHSTLSSKK